VGGLQIVDITDPAAPRRLGGLDTAGEARDVAVTGRSAVVADGTLGVAVIDVSDPARPRQEGVAPSGIGAVAVAADAGLAYVADPGVGLRILDVADPAEVKLVGTARLAAETRDLALDGSLVHLLGRNVADSNYVLAEVDVTEPAEPGLRASDELDEPELVDLAAGLGHLWLAAGRHAEAVVLRRRPKAPYPGSVGVMGVPLAVTALALAPDRPLAAVTNGVSAFLFDLSDAGRPVAVGRFGAARGHLAVARGYAYTLSEFRQPQPVVNLDVHALEPLGLTRLVGSVKVDVLYREVTALAAVPSALLLASGRALVALGLSDPARPYPFEPVTLPFRIAELKTHGNWALVTGEGSLALLDLAVPGRPVLVNTRSGLQPNSRLLALGDGMAAFRRPDGQVALLDLADLSSLWSPATWPATVTAVAIDGTRAFMMDGSSLQVYDLADRTQERELARLDLETVAVGLAVSGDQVLVGTPGDGLVVVAMGAGPDPPSPSPWPTVTPEPSRTPTATATPSPTATDTPDVTPTSPARPTRLWLPVAWAGREG
jgi:hypothetical protein